MPSQDIEFQSFSFISPLLHPLLLLQISLLHLHIHFVSPENFIKCYNE
ncbi:hypothetical protein HMPREF3191_01501 [Veillonellaceae bacterium DNF00626]|nr:hypothetical protein HMPREF3191_01501 [Veillonellaceae bacterium DNF00626]